MTTLESSFILIIDLLQDINVRFKHDVVPPFTSEHYIEKVLISIISKFDNTNEVTVMFRFVILSVLDLL